jgi:hypothetical protein
MGRIWFDYTEHGSSQLLLDLENSILVVRLLYFLLRGEGVLREGRRVAS